MSSATRPAAQIRLLLVEDVAQVSQYIKGLLDAQAQVKLLDVTSDGASVVDQIAELQPDVIVVDALLRGSVNGLQVAENIRQAGLSLPIIALTVPTKPLSIGTGMGIARVLSMPFSGFDFINLVKQVHDEHQAVAPDAMSRVYAVFGAKGGVGTSTLAYNIGAAMAAGGLMSVALVDASLQFGDLRALLRVDESVPSLLDLPTSKVSQSDLSEIAWRDRSGMDVFFAPPRPEMAEMISAQDMAKLLALLRRVYNIVLIDTPTAVNDATLALFDAADVIVVVLGFEEATLRQTRAMGATFEQIGYGAKLRYLLNRSDSTGGMPRDAIETRIGRRPDFAVVSDGRLVLEANNRGEAFVLADPGAQVSRDVARVAQALAEAVPVAGAVAQA